MPASDMHLGAKPILFDRARKMRFAMTPAEELLWSAINNKQLGVKFRNQHPLLFFIADFYCHELKLVIEVDGGYHKKREQFEYDESRTAELQEWNISVIRFRNEEIKNDLNQVVEKLKGTIAKKQIKPTT